MTNFNISKGRVVKVLDLLFKKHCSGYSPHEVYIWADQICQLFEPHESRLLTDEEIDSICRLLTADDIYDKEGNLLIGKIVRESAKAQDAKTASICESRCQNCLYL